jgi:hypothetical protein
VDDDDVTLLGAFYDPSAKPIPLPLASIGSSATDSSVVAVPEPATLLLGALAGLFIAAAFCRRSDI